MFESIMKKYSNSDDDKSTLIATAIVKHIEYYSELLKEFSSSDPDKK